MKILYLKKVGLETDASRLDADVKLAVSNADRLIKILDNLVDRIGAKYSKCPPTLRKTFELLAHVVGSKFPHLKAKIVGAVFFLRFINPGLSQPEKHDLVTKEIPMFQRKVLVQAAKMLQFVTNDSRYEVVANKEVETCKQFVEFDFIFPHRRTRF